MSQPIRLLHLFDIHFSTRAAWDANPVLEHLTDHKTPSPNCWRSSLLKDAREEGRAKAQPTRGWGAAVTDVGRTARNPHFT